MIEKRKDYELISFHPPFFISNISLPLFTKPETKKEKTGEVEVKKSSIFPGINANKIKKRK
jgi:hypothetical protein